MKPIAEKHLKLKTWSLPALIVALVILDLAIPYRGWVALLIGLGGVFVISYLWARSLARGLTFTREVRFGWAQVGDCLEERFTLVNQGWVPALWVEMMDHSTLPGYSANQATGVDARSTKRWCTHAECTQRGIFMLGPTTLATGDPFGLFQVTFRAPSSAKIIVLPPIVPLPNVQVAAGGRSREGKHRASAIERTVNAHSVREYVPGDSLNWIHWRTVARRDELYVRLLDNTPSGDWWIFLDLNERVQAGQGQHSTLEQGIIYAASLAVLGLRAGRAVGFVACSHDLLWLMPKDGEGQQWDILRSLALAQPGTIPIADLLARGQTAFKSASSLIVITPDVRGDWINSLAPLIWRGGVPTVLILDPYTFGGAGDVRPVMSLLADLQVTRYCMTREMLDRPEAMPGEQGRWDWRISPRGRAIPSHPPRDLRWRALA